MAMYVPAVPQLIKENSRKPRKPRPCLEVLQDPDPRAVYEDKLDELLADGPPADVTQLNDEICKGLKGATQSVCPDLIETNRCRH